jgi:hypothetical protein
MIQGLKGLSQMILLMQYHDWLQNAHLFPVRFFVWSCELESKHISESSMIF